jgi:hypothetical protein
VIGATVVDVGALWQAVWHAAVSGLFVTVVFSLAVLGTTRSGELRRVGRPGAGVAYAVLAALGAAGTVAAIAYGIILITTK